MEMERVIPVIDIQKLTPCSDIEEVKPLAKQLVSAFHEIGFAYLINHGVSDRKVELAFNGSKQFFERPVTKKLKFRRKNAAEGYHGAYGVDEVGINELNQNGQSLPNTQIFDFRESFDFFGDTTNLFLPCEDRDNVDHVFCTTMQDLQEACQPLCEHLLKLLAIGLELNDHDYFTSRSKWLKDKFVPSFKTFRALYYPSIQENIEIPLGQTRVKEHSDHGFITLLFQDDVGGLQVKDVQGRWVNAQPIPDSIVVNIGDLLEFWTGGYLRATKHQVLIPEEEIQRRTSRQSMVYFLHPDADTVLSPLPPTNLLKRYYFEPILAQTFAENKLAAVKSY